MSIASQYNRIKANIENAYSAASLKGAILPAVKNSESLSYCISTITATEKGNAETTLSIDTQPCQLLASKAKVGSGAIGNLNTLPEELESIGELMTEFVDSYDETELPEIQPTVYVAEGFDGDDWFVDDGVQQLYGNFPKGSITDFPRSMTIVVEPQQIYFYPYENDEYINGCLVNYIDNGSEKKLNVYVVYNDDKESDFLLIDGDITNSMMPSKYKYHAFIKEITVPKHTIFTLKPCKYEEWKQPVLIADNAYGTITSSGVYNNDYRAYRAINDSNSCWAVPNGYVGWTWWRWQFPYKLLVKSVQSRGRDNELFNDSCWYTDSTKNQSLCETYLQSYSDKMDCGYKELSEIYFTGYDGPNSGNPGLRNLRIEAVKGEHTWVAPEVQYTYTNPSDKILSYTFSNFTNNGEFIEGRNKIFYQRGYESDTFPIDDSKEFFTNNGCTKDGNVFTGGQGKSISLDRLIEFYNASNWEIVVAYTYNEGGSERPIISQGIGGVDYVNFQLTVNSSGTLVLYGSSNNTSWDVFNNTSTNFNLATGTEYLIKFTYDETKGYELQYSTDNGSSWTSTFTSETKTKLRCLKPFCLLANGYNMNSYYSNGSIDVSKSYIKVDDEYVWKAFETKTTYKSNGLLVNYEDDGSETTLGAYLVIFENGDKDIVLSSNNDFTIDGEIEHIFLKNVDVPTHDLYGYVDTKAQWTDKPILSTNGTPGGNTFATWASSEGYVYDDWSGEEKQTHAYYAFDGQKDTSGYPYSPTNTWIANGSSNQWLAFYSPNKLFVNSITMQNPPFYREYDWTEGYIFTSGKVQASLDGNDWFDISKEFKNNGPSDGQYTININSDTGYNYFRLYHTSSSTYPGISEISIDALTMQKGFVKSGMTYSIIKNTDRPDDITFDAFVYGDNQVFFGAEKIITDFYYTDSSASKSNACLINYEDDGSAVELNAYIIEYTDGNKDIVLSVDDTFEITDVVTKTFVGTISLDEHIVYEYTSLHQTYVLTSPFDNINTVNDFVNTTGFVDDTKLRINNDNIELVDSQKYDGVNMNSYMTVTGSSPINVTVSCYSSSEGNYDWGYIYMGTELYQPSREQAVSRENDGNGEFIYVGSGEGDYTTYNYTASPGTNYFIVGYTKDGSVGNGDDTIRISYISFEADSSTWTPITE